MRNGIKISLRRNSIRRRRKEKTKSILTTYVIKEKTQSKRKINGIGTEVKR